MFFLCSVAVKPQARQAHNAEARSKDGHGRQVTQPDFWRQAARCEDSAGRRRRRGAQGDHRIRAAEYEIWSAQMEGYGGPSQPSPTIARAIGAGYFFLEVKCHRCDHRGAVDLRTLHRHDSTEIWQLEASLSCERCRRARHWKTRVHMIKLSRTPDTHTPWYSPEETDRH